MFLRLILFQLILFLLIYLFLKFFIEERYFSAAMKVLTTVIILSLAVQTAALFFLTWI